MIIKKYKNRKYYSVEKSKFVDQEFIINLIKVDEELIILDNDNKDITVPEVLKLFRKELKKKE
ncbi:hypothetical protein ES695_04220 [Candidatus Atribacteria bacterium 1244-E10-H5-B2]|nr:MAG: hypothetical protein ES695_04220 [Candidatus Atribacteria bacterium 1244-E10-H5-B2]